MSWIIGEEAENPLRLATSDRKKAIKIRFSAFGEELLKGHYFFRCLAKTTLAGINRFALASASPSSTAALALGFLSNHGWERGMSSTGSKTMTPVSRSW